MLSVECILFSHPIIYLYLKALFNACMYHGYIPVSFKTGMIVPVPKSKVETEMSCEQFGPITIVPIFFLSA